MDLSWKSWLKLSFSLISDPDTGFRAARFASSSSAHYVRRLDQLNRTVELTDELIRVSKILRFGYIIPNFRLDDGLGFEKEASLRILEDHLKQVTDM